MQRIFLAIGQNRVISWVWTAKTRYEELQGGKGGADGALAGMRSTSSLHGVLGWKEEVERGPYLRVGKGGG